MTTTTYDAIVIGTGQAGPSLAARLVAAGMKVAVAERGRFGGTCVNTGCTPTKAMVASAYAAHLARRAADYGVTLGGALGAVGSGGGAAAVGVDMRRVKARKDAIVDQGSQGVRNRLTGLDGCTVYEAHARFTAPGEVAVGDDLLRAERIFLNVGGRAVVPDLPGLAEVSYLTNSSLMALDVLPRHLVIVGGSYIGLEIGQMFRRFGSEVTIVEKGERLIAREDPDVSDAILEILEGEGVTVRLNAHCIRVARHGDGILVGTDCGGGAAATPGTPKTPAAPETPEITGSHLLLAVGRRPNTDDLGLEAAGVRCDRRGFIEVDDQLRTNVAGIWALGDCNGRGAFTHTSYNDFEIVAANLLGHDPRRVTDRITTYGLFIDPPLGRAGMTEAEVRRSGRPALVAIRPMTRVSRAIEKGETQGFMKILVAADTREILGAAILGTGGDEAVHCVLDLMYAKAPCSVLQRAVHIHPTVSELLPTLVGELKPLT
jgi:pyruvate/2-oxoglutarate dehydrogenase complex dihydrolipoamide dehydrogenase (E3) component